MLEFQTTFNPRGKEAPLKAADSAHYTILLCGPLAGDSATAYSSPVPVDMDTFDTVMGRVSPSVAVNGQALAFKKAMDFEPLYLAAAVTEAKTWLTRLEAVRQGGAKCPAAIEAMAELQPNKDNSEATSANPDPAPDDSSTFESLLSGSTTVSKEPTRLKSNSIVDKIISSSLESSPSAVPEDIDGILNAIAGKLGDILRSVYHDPQYREIEGAWLAMNDMIGEFDSDDPVKFLLMPYSTTDWTALLGDGDTAAAMRTRLAETCPSRPNVIITTESLSASEQATSVHAGLLALSRVFHCPVVGNIDFSKVLEHKPSGPVTKGDLVETAPFEGPAQSPASPCVRLATPLYRYRLPWGEKWNPCGSFVFEECLPDCLPHGLPWGPASLLCAYAWASKYRDHEEDTNWNEVTQMGGFPPVTTRDKTFPATAYILTENAMAHLYSLGCLPLTAMANSDRILVGA